MAASKKDVAKQQVKEDREKVREMYLSGKTVKEIAKETYFSSSYCYAMVRDLAKEKNFAKKAKRAPLDEAMIQDAKAGMTVAEIAKKHGVTYQQCYYTVSEYAQATIKKNKKKQSAATKVRNAAMLEDAKAGMTDKEIAKNTFCLEAVSVPSLQGIYIQIPKSWMKGARRFLRIMRQERPQKTSVRNTVFQNPLFTRTCAKLEKPVRNTITRR